MTAEMGKIGEGDGIIGVIDNGWQYKGPVWLQSGGETGETPVREAP